MVTQGEGVHQWHERARNAVVNVNLSKNSPHRQLPEKDGMDGRSCGNRTDDVSTAVCAKARSAVPMPQRQRRREKEKVNQVWKYSPPSMGFLMNFLKAFHW